MLRYARSRYIALGLPSLLNAVLLPLYGLEINTGGSHDEYALLFYLAIAIASGLFGVAAMIKRARDIGSSAWSILLGFFFATPLMLLVALVLIFVPSNPEADSLEPATPTSLDTWLNGLFLLILPWIAILFLRAI